MKHFFWILFLLLASACQKEVLFGDDTRINLWLYHNGAEMPVVVEGNTNSKIFICLLHGGPGSTAQTFNTYFTPFTDALEEDYAMVYWDQRNSGLARGEWDTSKITIAQHTEDLDQVIDLLQHKFGTDIRVFLAGHSWGAYLGQAYLLEANRQAKIKAWININGLCHRNQDMKDALIKIPMIANEQIGLNQSVEDWTRLLEEVQFETDKNVQTYDSFTENFVFSLIRKAEKIMLDDQLLPVVQGSSFNASYRDNTHPFILNANKRTLNLLIPEMYDFDNQFDQELSTINLPSLFLYGHFDVRTPSSQADYVLQNIATPDADKQLVILPESGHSSVGNEPLKLASEIRNWVERYK